MPGSRSRTAVLIVAALAVASMAAPAQAAPAQALPAVPTVPSQPGTALPLPGDTAGAAVPFTEYQAENARTDGTRIGPDRGYTRLTAEASGRRAVALNAGEYVEFVLARAANAVDVRYSIADGPDVALAVSVDGRPGPRLTLTAKYSHAYGLYPFGNDPETGGHHHYFDDVRTLFGRTLPAGTRVRLTPAADAVIDLADFELVAAPGSAPAGALDAAAFGADPTGVADSGAQLQSAIDAARGQNRPLWIGPGTYQVNRRLQVDGVTVRGAGPWHTVLTGNGVGVFGNAAPTPSSGVHLADFAIFGTTTVRDDATVDSGFGGALGGGSTISNVWVEHTKVGMWFDGPSSGLTVTGARIQNTWADGINLYNGVSDTTVEQTFVRNTGDDGMAMWSASNADSGNTFSHNTVAVPLLANAYAIYGGRDNGVRDSVAADTVTQGGGVHAGNRFGAVPLAGTTTLAGNLLVRTGSLVPNDPVQIGALWFWAADSAIDAAIDVRDTAIVGSTLAAIQFYGKSITGVTVDRVAITGAGTSAVQIQSPGAATFRRVVATGLGAAGVQVCGDGFSLTRGVGDLGWSTTACGLPLRGQLTVAPAAGIDFGFRGLGTSTTQPITVTNPGPDPVEITAVHPPAGFTAPNTCGTLAAGQTCTITVGFAPRAAGNFAGRLSIDSTSPAGPYVVGVAGIGFDPDGDLALGRTATASSSCCFWLPAANLVDGDAGTYFETANNAFPQTLSVDLGQTLSVSRIVVKLPGGWGARTETIAVSADGAPLLPAADYTLDPDTGNVATLSFPATTARTLTLTVTGNTGWPAAQFSEIEVYAR